MKTLTDIQRIENAFEMANHAFNNSGFHEDHRLYGIIANVRGILRPGGRIPYGEGLEKLIAELDFSAEYFRGHSA